MPMKLARDIMQWFRRDYVRLGYALALIWSALLSFVFLPFLLDVATWETDDWLDLFSGVGAWVGGIGAIYAARVALSISAEDHRRKQYAYENFVTWKFLKVRNQLDFIHTRLHTAIAMVTDPLRVKDPEGFVKQVRGLNEAARELRTGELRAEISHIIQLHPALYVSISNALLNLERIEECLSVLQDHEVSIENEHDLRFIDTAQKQIDIALEKYLPSVRRHASKSDDYR